MKNKEAKQSKTKNSTVKKSLKKEMTPEEIFEQLATLSSCDCSSCPKNCFDK